MPRRLLSLALLAAVSCGPAAPEARDSPPHVVIFLADDLGWGDVGYHGSEIRTPTIDRLRDEGLELDSFYVLQVCSPTRAALLTGRHPMRYGLQTGVIRPWSEEGLDRNEELLPEVLKEAGYSTHIVGKWHLGSGAVEQLPMRRGFDHHYGQYLGKIDYFSREREGGLDWHRDGAPTREAGYSTHLIRDEAVRIVEAHNTRGPLFLYVPFSAPHFPLQAPEDEIAAYAEIGDDDRRVYAAMVTCMDRAIGDVLEALERRGMRERTLVLFFSDNGALETWGGSNGALRGMKGGLYEGGIRVPAVVSWPGRIAGGRRVDTAVHAIDWFPTLVRLAGLSTERRHPLDGSDLWPLLAGEGTLDREILLLNVEAGGTGTEPVRGALRAGRWKLVVDYSKRREGVAADPLAGLELFDLETDRYEKENRAVQEVDRCLELEEILRGYGQVMVPRPPDRATVMPEGFPIPEVWGPGS